MCPLTLNVFVNRPCSTSSETPIPPSNRESRNTDSAIKSKEENWMSVKTEAGNILITFGAGIHVVGVPDAPHQAQFA